MTRPILIGLVLSACLYGSASAGEAKLVRYPDCHNGKIVFSYLGDIWTADDDGKNINRLTVHTARDIHPRFSPDGRSIAFSSDRDGNMDVYLIPTAGGAVKRLTIHTADDTVVDWTPDGKSVLFASQRGEDFMGKLYVVSIDGGMARDAGPDMGVTGSYSPDGNKLVVTRNRRRTGASTTAAPIKVI
jgi:tricorn protease